MVMEAPAGMAVVVVGTIAAAMEEAVGTMEAASSNMAAAEGEQAAGDKAVALRPIREAIQAEAEAVSIRLQ